MRIDNATVIDLALRRRTKAIKTELANGRNPLVVSHLRGTIVGGAEGYTNKLCRVRQSLAKIESLISELRKLDRRNNA